MTLLYIWSLCKSQNLHCNREQSDRLHAIRHEFIIYEIRVEALSKRNKLLLGSPFVLTPCRGFRQILFYAKLCNPLDQSIGNWLIEWKTQVALFSCITRQGLFQ